MLKLRKDRPAPAPPVIPGPAGTTRGAIPPCEACGTTGSGNRRGYVLPSGFAGILCVDGHECAVRYRQGTSPASYAAGLRGEILGVAP